MSEQRIGENETRISLVFFTLRLEETAEVPAKRRTGQRREILMSHRFVTRRNLD